MNGIEQIKRTDVEGYIVSTTFLPAEKKPMIDLFETMIISSSLIEAPISLDGVRRIALDKRTALNNHAMFLKLISLTDSDERWA